MTDFMKFARRRGLVPDWAWYQLNGKSAEENFIEQRKKIYEKFADQEDGEEDAPQVSFASGVKVK